MDTWQEYRAVYRPGGRVHWFKLIPGLIATAGVAVVLAWCLSFAFENGFYLILVAPFIAGLALAGTWYVTLTWSHCRNKRFAVASSIALALISSLGSYEFGLLKIVGVRNVQRIDLLPAYIQLRMKTDAPRPANRPRANIAQTAGPTLFNTF